MRLTVADATKARDAHALLSFACWDGDPELPWAGEAEHFIRTRALASTYKTLVFRAPDRTVAAVSAFDRREVGAGRRQLAAWHLQVVGVRRDLQRTIVESEIAGCPTEMRVSEYVLRKSFERMIEIDPERVLVTARVHEDNRPSIVACARVDLQRTERERGPYWRMFGEADPTISCA